MATVGDGNKAVLLVVDVQAGVVDGAWDAPRIVANVASAVDRARSSGMPVIWVQHAGDELIAGSPEWQWAEGLAPQGDEVVIGKGFNSSFEQTDLEATLRDLGATHVVLAGAATNWCIRATAYGVLERGYDLTLVSDAHTTGTMELGSKSIEASDIVDELNTAMSWVSYPGRTNRAVAVGEIDFRGLAS